MKTKYIFIDTSIFIGNNYDYKNSVFKKLATLSATGKLNVFITDITIKEIEANIEDELKKALEKVKLHGRILRHLDMECFKGIFNPPSEANLITNWVMTS